MNFRLAEKIIATRFQVRDRENPDEIVDYLPNPAQRRLFALCQKLHDEHRRLRIISVKSRRIGFSRAIEALGVCFMVAYPNFEGRVMAHFDETALDIMSSAALMVYGDGTPGKGIPRRGRREIWEPDEEYKTVVVPHGGRGRGSRSSRLLRASAKVRGKGRGMGFSFYHGSEAGYYPADSPFTAVLPALAKSPDRSFAAIESTGNGIIGDGEAFYKYWQQASDPDKIGDSEWVRFFVPWIEDPYAVSNQIPKDIPKDDEEKILLKLGLTKQQIAYRRIEIATTYQGIVEDWNVECPLTPEDAFLSGGVPAFAHEEISYVKSTVRDPRLTAELERTRDPWVIKLSPMGVRGRIKIWELPQPRMEYYIGADLARGEDFKAPDAQPGDYAAITVINGSTGEQAASFCDRIDPSKMADLIDKLGRFYRTPEIAPNHCAMLNIEVNANLGAECQRLLRDRYAYPVWRFARWRGGKDDRYNRKAGTAIGWETTGASRKLMFAAARTSLREKAVCVRDSELCSQICSASMNDGRWEILHGHDDLLASFLMSWISRQQFPPRVIAPRKDIPEDAHPLAEFDGAMFPLVSELARSEQKEMDQLIPRDEMGRPRRRPDRRDPLAGILTEPILG